jgi:hypothetical protein
LRALGSSVVVVVVVVDVVVVVLDAVWLYSFAHCIEPFGPFAQSAVCIFLFLFSISFGSLLMWILIVRLGISSCSLLMWILSVKILICMDRVKVSAAMHRACC